MQSPRDNEFGKAYAEIVGKVPRQHPVAWVDLAAGPKVWRSHLRKSYRSLVNWGGRNLAVECYTGDSLTSQAAAIFQGFHYRIAGRITRPLRSWELLWNEVSDGHGELLLGYMHGLLVSSALIIDGIDISVYWSAVYDRERFDKPLAHYPLWLSMERAAERGMKWMELGDVPPAGTACEKEVAIGFFKRGFATHVFPPGNLPGV